MTRFWKAVLITTLVAGTLDIAAAHVNQAIRTGAFPTKIFYVIAAGAIGLKSALTGGATMIALGAVIHYFISFSFTLLFFLLYPAVRKISKNKYLNGIVYGAVVWLIMNRIVLPLSALPSKPFVFDNQALTGLLILMFIFGLPISILANNYYRSATPARTAV